MEHKFKIGQAVLYTPEPFGLSQSIEGYEIVRLLSSGGFDPEYQKEGRPIGALGTTKPVVATAFGVAVIGITRRA